MIHFLGYLSAGVFLRSHSLVEVTEGSVCLSLPDVEDGRHEVSERLQLCEISRATLQIPETTKTIKIKSSKRNEDVNYEITLEMSISHFSSLSHTLQLVTQRRSRTLHNFRNKKE